MNGMCGSWRRRWKVRTTNMGSVDITCETVADATHSAKYHAPITPAVVTLNKPLPTPQLQSQTTTVPTIAQFAHPLTCHSHVELVGREKYPIKSSRKMRV